jgi:hypothetical protein
MAFSLTKLLKGLRLTQENTTSPANLDLVPAGTANTTTTVTTSQTANHTITLPNETGTVLTTASTIDLDQLEAVTANRALASNGTGHIISTSVTDTELGYVSGVTSAIQPQLNTLTSNVSTLTSSKANVSLNNILPTTAIDINGQKITNSAAPTVGSDLTNKTYVDNAVTGGGANLSLSNLVSTAVNAIILPGTTNSLSFGSISKQWVTGYFAAIINSNGSSVSVVGSTLSDTTGNSSVEWTNRKLTSGATTKLDWSGTDVSLNTRKLTNVSDPTAAQDAATKSYVDTGPKVFVARYTDGSFPYPPGAINFPCAYATTVINSFGGTPYNAATGVFTVPLAGLYRIDASYYASYPTNTHVVLKKNGTDYAWDFKNGGSVDTFHINEILQLSVSDLLSLYIVSSNTGGSAQDNIGVTYLNITYLGT